MKLKSVILVILSVILTVALAIGATLAYLKDVDSADNVMTLGEVHIALREYERKSTETTDDAAAVQPFNNNKPLLPAVIDKEFDYTAGDTYVDWDSADNQIKPGTDYTSPIWDPSMINNEVDKMVFVENTGDYSAYVRIYFAFEAGNFTTLERFKNMIHVNLNDNEGEWKWEWVPFLATNDEDGKYFIANATYQKVLDPGKLTEISLSQIALDSLADNEDVAAFGDTYEVFVNAQGIQSAGFDDPDEALDEGFGANIPFDMTLAQGVTLYDALHYLNGNNIGTDITANVATVTFGFNKDHADVVANYEGTLTSVEQDAQVYTYYVPNATNSANYDIYVLADDTIYTPKISTDLFRNMNALTTVDTTNLDVSRTENMQAMFRDCHVLTSIDVSNWDVSNVSTMKQAFLYCKQLSTIDVSEWDLSGATSLNRMFYGCPELTYLDVSDWETGNVTDMMCLFYDCIKLNNLDVSDWDVSNVTNMSFTFAGCMNLESLDVSNWNVSNVTTFSSFLQSSNDHSGGMKIKEIKGIENWNTSSATVMSWMFYGCSELTKLNLNANPEIGAWDVSKVTTMYHMFSDCMSLTTLNMKGWNTESLTDMDGIFNTCISLKVIDVSDFDTQNVTDMAQVFETCYALEEIIGLDKWNTSNVTTMYQMFASPAGYNVSNHLKVLDLSSFDTSNVTNMFEMFQSSPDLVTIYVGDGWSTENVTDSTNMFKKCPSIVGEKGTTFDSELFDMTYAHVDGGTENPGYFTYKAAPSTNP